MYVLWIEKAAQMTDGIEYANKQDALDECVHIWNHLTSRERRTMVLTVEAEGGQVLSKVCWDVEEMRKHEAHYSQAYVANRDDNMGVQYMHQDISMPGHIWTAIYEFCVDEFDERELDELDYPHALVDVRYAGDC